MDQALAEDCVYTIVHLNELTDAHRKGQAATFNQARRWVTGLALWQRAKKAGKGMPVLLGDSTDCSQLLFWGLLTSLAVDDDKTTFTVDRVRQLPPGHTPQKLVLRSSGNHIAPNFIRPYAICRTPEFVTPPCPELELLIASCTHLLRSNDAFWLIPALSDISYEEGVHHENFLRSWTEEGLDQGLLQSLKAGINGQLFSYLEATTQFALLTRRTMRNGKFPDTFFQLKPTDGITEVQVKLLFDCTYTKHFDSVRLDMIGLKERAHTNAHGFLIVFFTQLPNFHYPRGFWHGASKAATARACVKKGIDAQFRHLLGQLGVSPTWPAEGPLRHPLQLSEALFEKVRTRLKRVFKPENPASNWEFAKEHLCDAQVGVAIWQF
jgi:hypothetical protein